MKVLLFAAKLVLALLAVALLFLMLALSGALFAIWPTGFGDLALNITPQTLEQLRALRAERKFAEDMAHFYPGAPNEAVRSTAQSGIDHVVDELLAGLPERPRRSFVLARIKSCLPLYRPMDSEEQDQALRYFERIMSVTGVQSSGELLNVWRYGLPLGWLPGNKATASPPTNRSQP